MVLTVTFKILCGLAPASHTSHNGLPHSVLLRVHTLVLISLLMLNFICQGLSDLLRDHFPDTLKGR